MISFENRPKVKSSTFKSSPRGLSFFLAVAAHGAAPTPRELCPIAAARRQGAGKLSASQGLRPKSLSDSPEPKRCALSQNGYGSNYSKCGLSNGDFVAVIFTPPVVGPAMKDLVLQWRTEHTPSNEFASESPSYRSHGFWLFLQNSFDSPFVFLSFVLLSVDLLFFFPTSGLSHKSGLTCFLSGLSHRGTSCLLTDCQSFCHGGLPAPCCSHDVVELDLGFP